ncbi:MAG TPA: aminotransferase class I/II-fold pyridoxal phosphate-dependent enzyme [Thermoanaerobaculia bacterium]|nr:aminotransferase class I/II-fold pyridoxal phosphate-dependent enzyme [Thermoanaerobaculia bacterium]
MPLDRLLPVLAGHVAALEAQGTAKGRETVVREVLPAAGGRGPRFLLEGEGDRPFLRMNSNSYLGMGLAAPVIAAEEESSRRFGAGPGAVRFISGTYRPHVELERRLAAFHGREAAMIFSSAYATVVSVLVPLVADGTVVISDELNHNSIINGIRLARPAEKAVYPHNDVAGLGRQLAAFAGKARRALVVTDGVFSMRGDQAPLPEIVALARDFDGRYEEGVVVVVDDSHGVGALGDTGRGTEETTGARADLLVGTLGKAFGVNGGYVAADAGAIAFLRETSPMYIYSNPITPAEAAAATAALDLLDSAEGRRLLAHLHALTRRFEAGLVDLGYEVIPGEHPVVPLLVRDTERTRDLVRHLRARGILATGLAYPVVPRGDEEIRFQVCADHTEADVDEVLAALAEWSGRDALAAGG